MLLGPYLGDRRLIRSIRDAGGLAGWEPSESDGFSAVEVANWEWLRGYATDPGHRPALYVGVGEEDGIASGTDLLAPHLPPRRYGVTEGGHEWGGFRLLWRRLLASPPWSPGEGNPRIDR